MRFARVILLSVLMMLGLVLAPAVKVNSQALPVRSAIKFNSFTGDYHLSRDALGRSLLTAEEVILADFPGNTRYFGITRAIPKQYQNRNVEVKVLSITDAAGNPVPYKTSSDKSGNLLIATGDPSITLYGSQTFRIRYQTRGVIDVGASGDLLLLNVNGRGWDTEFGQVSAAVHIPKDFQSSLAGKPSCYIGYLKAVTNDCAIDSQTQPSETLITSKTNGPVPPYHALVVKINFKQGTFTNKESRWERQKPWLLAALSIFVLFSSFIYLRRSLKH
jgi:hypothetical protein